MYSWKVLLSLSIKRKDDTRRAIKKLSGSPILLRSRYLLTTYKNRPGDVPQLELKYSFKVTM